MQRLYKTQEDYAALWRRLEDTRKQLRQEGKLFCIRRVMQEWLGSEANDDMIWEVCFAAEQYGYDPLPLPSLYPLPHREFLKAWITLCHRGAGLRTNLRWLDRSYSVVFPRSTPINVEKKRQRASRVTASQ